MNMIKNLFLLALTTFALFSCSNGEDSIPEQKTKNVVVQFAPSSLSRAVGTPVTATDKAEVNDYYIFFLDAAGNVVEGTKSLTTKPDLSQAITCTNVGATAVSAYMVANIGSSLANIDLSNISTSNTLAEIKAKTAEVSKQQTIGSVVLSNSAKTDNGKIIATTTSGATTYAATIELAPAISRLEIAKITGTGDVKGFKLDAIYIDGHAVKFNIGGGYDKTPATGTNIKDGIYSIGVDNSLLSGYPSEFGDIPGSAIEATEVSGKYVASPETGKVWAYQLAAGAPMPKIIVQLKEVKDGSTTSGVKYVTVTNYKVGGNAYTQLVAGTVYKIDEISFEVKNTAEVPNATEKNVDVTVTIKAWDGVNRPPEV